MVQKVNVVDKDMDQSTIVSGGSNVYQMRGKDFYYVYCPDVVKKENVGPVIKKSVERNTIQNRNRNMGIQYEANSQRHQMKWDNGRGNPLVMGKAFQSRNLNMHSENAIRYIEIL